MNKICSGCGIEFETNRSARTYCSRECANKANGSIRAVTEPPVKRYKVWSSGGGVQSTAIAVLIETGRIEKPDYGIMVDVGYEKTATLDYMRDITIPRMQSAGVPFYMLSTTDYTNNDLTDGKGHVNIPAFRLKPDGTISKLDTRCNGTWKVRVTRIWARRQGIKKMENWLGISSDEAHRAKPSRLKWIDERYPLIELGMDRAQCIVEIQRAGWPVPPRSSCVFCPQQSKGAWQTVRDTPADWARALEAERIIRDAAPDVYLHKKCLPIGDIWSSDRVTQSI